MKTLKLVILLVSVSLCSNAQSITGINQEGINDGQIIYKANSTEILKMLSLMVEPQIGGLFDASYKHVKGIANFKNYFKNFDLGIKMGFSIEKIKNLKIASMYNVGVLRFNSFGPIPGAVFKASISYNF